MDLTGLMNRAFRNDINRKIGRGYRVESNKKIVKVEHYGTEIYRFSKKKNKPVLLGGYSKSDQSTLNKLLNNFPNPQRKYVSRKGGFHIIERND